MLSVDPSLAFFKQWPGMGYVLQIRQWFQGQSPVAAPDAAKFMYSNVGEVHLITWSVDVGHKVGQPQNRCSKHLLPQL